MVLDTVSQGPQILILINRQIIWIFSPDYLHMDPRQLILNGFIWDPHKGNMQRKSILFAGLLNFFNKPLFWGWPIDYVGTLLLRHYHYCNIDFTIAVVMTCWFPHLKVSMLMQLQPDCQKQICRSAAITTLSEGLAQSTVHNHLTQLSVHLQSGTLFFIGELPGVI